MRKNKGFTLIELMIVIAIIAIIAAIAIPNLLQSRIRANESNATSQIRNYAAAQAIFNERDAGALPANRGTAAGTALGDVGNEGYCAQYDLLFYGFAPVAGGDDEDPVIAGPTQLRLISVAHANAALYPSASVTADLSVEFNGYWFGEPTTGIPAAVGGVANFFNMDYAQLALPANSDRTGSKAFYVDSNGTVMAKLLPAGYAANPATAAGTVGAFVTPINGTAATLATWDY